MQPHFFLGLDVGSTTVKLVLLDEAGAICHARYERHLSDAHGALTLLLKEAAGAFPDVMVSGVLTGSGAIALAPVLRLPFVQEVMASTAAIQRLLPQTDVAIELGGEDAKITFFDGGIEQRMNETCAGGTGAFIDQMASYLQTDAAGLDELAGRSQTIYPIASRCGVFAKTDIMPLLNEGAAKEDIAASIFQAVVEQTVSGLACGRAIAGNVALLGGPLHFLSQLRARFRHTLKDQVAEFFFPENAHYFVAIGAALEASQAWQRQLSAPAGAPAANAAFSAPLLLADLADRAGQLAGKKDLAASLPPLFQNQSELEEFKRRHSRCRVPRRDPATFTGQAFLGVDAGSTTMKAVLIDEDGALLFSSYGHNCASPLQTAAEALQQARLSLNKEAGIVHSGVTGYGSSLLRAAFGLDMEEVETIAHYRAAKQFCPDATFVLDIGGQDMKCLHATCGHIDSIMLNEACSAGCGVFIETFAQSLRMDAPAFAEAALKAAHPVDLGSRCTVFMNSRVKQAQKEGHSVEDIAAGLAYAVIRNALFKVIKTPSVEKLGPVIVAQGGAFYNDALLRAFERLLGRDVIRPDIAGLMGAYGAALLARDRFFAARTPTTLLAADKIASFSSTSRTFRCGGCGNRCRLTLNRFNDGRRHVSGNRCEQGARLADQTAAPQRHAPNLYAWKNRLLFNRRSLPAEQAPRGLIGLPRALNMFEDYPFWHAFFTQLGFRVEVSAPSSKEIFNLGLSTIPSQTICYPAKLAHGHLLDLVRRGIKDIFFPCVMFEQKEFPDADNAYNCPVVASHPEILTLNIDALARQGVRVCTPFIALHDEKKLGATLYRALAAFFSGQSFSRDTITEAISAGRNAMSRFKQRVRRVGECLLAQAKERHSAAIVLAGHPYHLDPEIHHGIPDMIAGLGVPVLTEDAVAHLGLLPHPLRVMDQWTYHSRLYRSAALAATRPQVEFIQLTSFGCGLDAVTSDQCQEILASSQKSYTLLKIDEGSNLGAARIRIRSLLATLDKGEKRQITAPQPYRRAPFTQAMRKTRTILIPQFSPIHFRFLEAALARDGYQARLLPAITPHTVETGLKYVNNDACYPAIVVIGQLMEALLGGDLDPDQTALMISQTGGGCRATNYVGFLRKALGDAGLERVPVISFNMAGLEENPGFTPTPALLKRIVRGAIYGDVLSRLFYRVRPYEKEKGAAAALLDTFAQVCRERLDEGSRRLFRHTLLDMLEAFDKMPCHTGTRPKVGMVGEILLKYHIGANNHAADLIEAEGGEAVPTDLANFLLYSFCNRLFNARHLASAPLLATWKDRFFLWWIEHLRHEARKALARYPRFGVMPPITHLQKLASSLVSLGHQMGEGWLLTAEMIALIQEGVPNILCMQPFACLPNHSTGKGVMKELKRRYPLANIAPIDYDPGASEVNQINRIKLMMAVAHQNLRQKMM